MYSIFTIKLKETQIAKHTTIINAILKVSEFSGRPIVQYLWADFFLVMYR